MSNFQFKDRDGQTPLPTELHKGLKPKHIQTMGELDEYEEQNIAEGLAWLAKQNDPGTTYTFWLKLHKKLFSDVWEWAGQVRTHELNNPDFHEPYQIWTGLRQLEGDLAILAEREILFGTGNSCTIPRADRNHSSLCEWERQVWKNHSRAFL